MYYTAEFLPPMADPIHNPTSQDTRLEGCTVHNSSCYDKIEVMVIEENVFSTVVINKLMVQRLRKYRLISLPMTVLARDQVQKSLRGGRRLFISFG